MIIGRGLLALLVALPLAGSGEAAAGLSGAGATFPFPLYQAWAAAYRQQTGREVHYEPVGSGNGIKRLEAGLVAFAASDIPLEPAELQAAGLAQFPVVVGGVVPVAHRRAMSDGAVRLSGPVLADILGGRIRRWDDPALLRLNPGQPLPDQPITVIHRSDASGTTFLLAHYLSQVSPAWRDATGVGSILNWPTGFGAKGNEGVAALVARTPGAIGYVEYSYARREGLMVLPVQNREGAYPPPGRDSFQAAAANADWAHAPAYSLFLTNQRGNDSWPITGASFMLMRRHSGRVANARQLQAFFGWTYHEGRHLAERLDYAPLPESVVTRIEQEWPGPSDGYAGLGLTK